MAKQNKGSEEKPSKKKAPGEKTPSEKPPSEKLPSKKPLSEAKPNLTRPDDAPVARSNANAATIRALSVLIAIVLIVIAFFLGRATASPNGGSGAGAGGVTAHSLTGNLSDTQRKLKDFVAQTGLVPGQDFAPSVSSRESADSLRQAAKAVDTPEYTRGKHDAPVTLTVMSDFSCPMCTRWEQETLPTLEKLAKAGEVKLQWLNLVIFAEQYRSDIAAHGAIAAAKQGKLWEFVHAAYESAGEGSHEEYDDNSVIRIAKSAGVADMKRFEIDLNSEETEQEMQRQSHLARSIGVNGTPFFIVGDSVISGAFPAEYFANTIKYQKFLAQH